MTIFFKTAKHMWSNRMICKSLRDTHGYLNPLPSKRLHFLRIWTVDTNVDLNICIYCLTFETENYKPTFLVSLNTHFLFPLWPDRSFNHDKKSWKKYTTWLYRILKILIRKGWWLLSARWNFTPFHCDTNAILLPCNIIYI